MCEIMERWKNELLSQGEKAGYASGEKSSAIRVCRDFGRDKCETETCLKQSLHLSVEEAREAIETYWG